MKRVILTAFFAFALIQNVFASTTKSQDTFFETDEIVYDKNTGVFTSVGYTDVNYNKNNLKTKTLEFNTNTNEISAKGSIDITNPDGTMTSENMVINTENNNATIGKTDVKFGENSYASSKSAEMVGKDEIVLHNVEYTACKEGLNNCGKTPTWKIGANKITHDTTDGSLVYTNALLYMFDVPVFYLPYLVSYTPQVKNKSGLLFPSFGTSSNLGYVAQIPVFFKINPYNDMTITPMFTSKKGTVLITEYRTNQDYFQSVTNASFKTAEDEGKKRWYLKTKNYFEINDVWRGIVNVERTSDDTYLRLYNFDSDNPWLSSQIGIEGAYNRSYLTANTYFYQDLRNLVDGYTPKVLPIIDYRRVSEPNSIGGYWNLNLNTSHIIKDYKSSGSTNETNFRTSSILKYSQPFKTDNGHLFDLTLGARGDLYILDDIHNTNEYGETGYYSGTKHRGELSADLMWKYPLYRSYNNRTEILQPVVQVITSNKQSGDPEIPNMDSKYMELETENLFSSDRFSGYDVFESGTRVNYGLNFIQNYNNNQKLSLFIGQNYNIDVPDDIYLENSGLANTKGASDIVASVTYSPSDLFRLKYKTRMDHENFRIYRNDVNFYVGPRALNLTINYVYLRNMFIEDDLPVRKDEINTYLSSQLTHNWRIFAGNRYDLYQNRDINIIGGVVYENDCFKFALNVINEFTRDRDYVGDKAVYFSLSFKTLGTVSSSFGVGSSSGSDSASASGAGENASISN